LSLANRLFRPRCAAGSAPHPPAAAGHLRTLAGHGPPAGRSARGWCGRSAAGAATADRSRSYSRGRQPGAPAACGPARPWPGHPDGVQQRPKLGALVALAGGDQRGQWAAVAVAGQMELGGQSAAAAPEGLVAVSIGAYVGAGSPFRAPAACWWRARSWRRPPRPSQPPPRRRTNNPGPVNPGAEEHMTGLL
jgi:hypothetical protein